MIVQVDYRIAKPYHERLSIIEDIILNELERRKKFGDLNWFKKEKAFEVVTGYDLSNYTCYSCLNPIFLPDKKVLFIELSKEGVKKTYLHLKCVKQKV